MKADAFADNFRAGVFVTSSRGGLVKVPNSGVATFGGPEWTDIAWMEVGLYSPNSCDDPDSDCEGGEQGLDVFSVRFVDVSVPEPATTLLLGTGLVALLRHRRRAND